MVQRRDVSLKATLQSDFIDFRLIGLSSAEWFLLMVNQLCVNHMMRSLSCNLLRNNARSLRQRLIFGNRCYIFCRLMVTICLVCFMEKIIQYKWRFDLKVLLTRSLANRVEQIHANRKFQAVFVCKICRWFFET